MLDMSLTAPADFATAVLSFEQLLTISTDDFTAESMGLWIFCLWMKLLLKLDDLLHLCKSSLINNRRVMFFNDDLTLFALIRVAPVFIIREGLLKLSRA